MPAVIKPELSGFAQVEAQLTLPAQSAPVTLSGDLIFKEASFKENVFTGLSEYTLTYSATTLDFVEKALKACELSGTPQIRFRYGYGQPNSMQWLSWQSGIIIQATSMPASIGQEAGHSLMLTVGNALYTSSRPNKTKVRKGLISDIVSQIAAENYLDAVVEPTQNQFAYIQSYQDDVEFISQRMQPRAVNTNGHGNYLFYVRDNVLHFHTPDYQANYIEFDYYESPHMHLGQSNIGQMLFDRGVSGTRCVAYDPYTAKTNELVSDPSKALKLASTLPQFSSVALGERNILYHLGENRPEESINIGQNAYERARMEAYKVTLSTKKVLDIRAGDFMNLVVSPSASQTSTWSGTYLVLETTYLIKGGAVLASLTMTRGETASNLGQISVEDPGGELMPETEAPGHSLNLRDLQNSQQTKGAGNKTSATTYAEVADANKMPS